MTQIKTWSGRLVDIEAPREEDIDIRDIAHALSFLCRGSGQVNSFFPVAAHCVFCAREALGRGFGRETALACLLHDASEAYMADVPHPIKTNLIPAYRVVEDRLLETIYRKYIGRRLTAREAEAVEEIDHDLLQYDLRYLLNMDVALPELYTEITYDFRAFGEAEKEFLTLFASLFHLDES